MKRTRRFAVLHWRVQYGCTIKQVLVIVLGDGMIKVPTSCLRQQPAVLPHEAYFEKREVAVKWCVNQAENAVQTASARLIGAQRRLQRLRKKYAQ